METFDYDDIQLVPNKCIIKSRNEADTSVKFGPKTFKIPVVPANMESVIDEDLAIWLAQNDYYYVMHRFQPEDRADFVKRMHDRGLFASISVGIKDSEYDFIDRLKSEHLVPEYITIDVAHGHSDYVIKMIRYIKQPPATLPLRKPFVNWKMPVPMLPKSASALVKPASLSSRPALALVAGSWPHCVCAARPPASR